MNGVTRAAFGLIALLCSGCTYKELTVKITASASKTFTLSGVGTLNARLEIRELGSEAIATTWFSFAGTDALTVASSVKLFRYDTSNLLELTSKDADFDIDPASEKSITTDTTKETRRRCASLIVSATGFDAEGNEKTSSGTIQVCERA